MYPRLALHWKQSSFPSPGEYGHCTQRVDVLSSRATRVATSACFSVWIPGTHVTFAPRTHFFWEGIFPIFIWKSLHFSFIFRRKMSWLMFSDSFTDCIVSWKTDPWPRCCRIILLSLSVKPHLLGKPHPLWVAPPPTWRLLLCMWWKEAEKNQDVSTLFSLAVNVV